MNPIPGHDQGFNLGESELGIFANIDPEFRGVATISLLPAGGASVENAFVQTTALDNGLNLKFGRFFSGLGYLNEQHAHTWDFVDQPLVYSVLWGDQLNEDGVQLKWLAPTDMFVEVGGEIGTGSQFSRNGYGEKRQRRRRCCLHISATTSASSKAGVPVCRYTKPNRRMQ